MLKPKLFLTQDAQSMHVFRPSCETVLAASSYQQQQRQVQDRLLPAITSLECNMDAQRTLAFAVHTAVMGSVLTSAQKQAFVSGGLPCLHGCGSGNLMEFSSRTSTPGPTKSGCSAPVQQQLIGAHLQDSTSPLSSDSLAVIDGVLTPCAADSISIARVGCKRSYHALEQYQQVVPFEQAATQQQQALAQLRQHKAQHAIELQTKHAVLLIKQRQAQQQRQQQQQLLQQQAQQTLGLPSVQQQHQLQQHHQQQQQLQALLAARQHNTVVQAVKVAAASNSLIFTAAPQQQQQQQLRQQLLLPQGSGNSTSSSLTTDTAAPRISAAGLVPQCVQQQQLIASAGMLPQPFLGSASSVTTTSSSNSSSNNCASLFASYLQQQQSGVMVQQQQRPPKRAATQAAVAALMSATAASQARAQQQLALLQPLASASSSNNLQGLAPQAAVDPCRILLRSNRGTGLLTWAGQVLTCQLQDAYLLAQHIFKRVAGRLDDMLLISLGVTVPVDNITMLVSLWVATKLEGHRRQVAGCSKLASALQLLPWAVTSVELHVMQLLNWQPYAGWALRPQEPSCVVTEY